jgi:hypothetical protein
MHVICECVNLSLFQLSSGAKSALLKRTLLHCNTHTKKTFAPLETDWNLENFKFQKIKFAHVLMYLFQYIKQKFEYE